jgi:hypothetical protein
VECRERVQAAKQGLELARGTKGVPEPSPLYWEALRTQVGRRIAEEPPVPAWRRWGRAVGAFSLVPAAAAVLLLALLPFWRKSSPDPALPAWEALPPAAEDTSLDVLRGLVYEGNDLEAAAGCRDVVECLSTLSEEESQALTDALRSSLEEGRS